MSLSDVHNVKMLNKATMGRLILLSLLWGSEFLLISVALRTIGPVEIVFVRLGLAAALLLAIGFFRDERYPTNKTFYLHCAVLGVMATVVPYFLMAWAQQRISSALTGILVGAGPLMTALLALVFLATERLTRLRLLGLVIGFIGIVVVVEPWNTDVGGDLLGSLAALGVALGFAAGYVYNVRFLTETHVSGPMIMGVQSLFGCLLAGMWLVTTWSFDFEFESRTFLSLVLLGLLNTGVAAIIFFQLLRSAGAVATSLVEYLMVIVAIVLGVTFLDEKVTLVTLAGVVLILGGVALAERRAVAEQSP